MQKEISSTAGRLSRRVLLTVPVIAAVAAAPTPARAADTPAAPQPGRRIMECMLDLEVS
jgi:hypothetical protein